MKAAKRIRKLLKSKWLMVLLYAVLTAGILHVFRTGQILWSVHIVQEALLMCPGPQTYESSLPSGEIEANSLANLKIRHRDKS